MIRYTLFRKTDDYHESKAKLDAFLRLAWAYLIGIVALAILAALEGVTGIGCDRIDSWPWQNVALGGMLVIMAHSIRSSAEKRIEAAARRPWGEVHRLERSVVLLRGLLIGVVFAGFGFLFDQWVAVGFAVPHCIITVRLAPIVAVGAMAGFWMARPVLRLAEKRGNRRA